MRIEPKAIPCDTGKDTDQFETLLLTKLCAERDVENFNKFKPKSCVIACLLQKMKIACEKQICFKHC